MCQKKLPTPDGAGSMRGSGVTRRDFLRFAGLGAASIMTASQAQPALAAENATTATTSASNGRVVGWLTWDDHGTTKTPFVFEPDFFATSAMKYNAHLATFGCCVALAAINAEPNGGSDGSYHGMVKNIESLMHQAGCDNIETTGTWRKATVDGVDLNMFFVRDSAWNYDYDHQPSYDYSKSPKSSIGLYAAHRKINVGAIEYNLIMMGIRGGNYEIEWCSNLTLDDKGNHQGFQEAANHAAAFLKYYVEAQGLTGPTKVLISGQSRAGATTNLTAGKIVKYAMDNYAVCDKERGYNLSTYFTNGNVEIWQSDLYAYGYGVPSGLVPSNDAERKTAKEKFGNVHNIINPCDMVPKVAPAKWGFMRYGTDKVLPGPSDRSRYTAGREKMKDRLYVLANHRTDGARFSYTVDSFPAIDYSTLKIYGSLVKKCFDMKTLDGFIGEFVDLVATDVFHSRVKGAGQALPGYYDRYQKALIIVFELYVKMPQDKELNAKGTDGKSPLEKFTELASSKIKANIPGLFKTCILSQPLTDVITYVDEAMAAVKINDTKTVDSVYGTRIRTILKLLLEWDYCVSGPGSDFLVPDKLKYYSTLSLFISQHTQEVFAMSQKAGVVMSTHNSELCLAWLQSRDSYYNKYGRSDLPDAPGLTAQASVASLSDEEGSEVEALATDAGIAVASLEASVNDSDAREGGEAEQIDWTIPNEAVNTDVSGESDEGTDEDWAETYRKVVFNGGTSISYRADGMSYRIFENGDPVFADDEGTLIAIAGQECPFIYGLDADLQQVVYLSDGANGIDGSTEYTFTLTADPDAPVMCTATRHNATTRFPESLFVYESPVGCYDEPLENYEFTVELSALRGISASASGESFESFSCDFDTAGVKWQAQKTEATEKDSGDDIVARYYYIDTRTADDEMGGIAGGGTNLRGTKSLVTAVPFDGYEFDYWTLDDKYLVDGQEASPYGYVEFETNEDGEIERIEPESVTGGEWFEGQRVPGEVYQGYHVYRALVDADHLVTAHFKKASTTPDNGESEDAGNDGVPVTGGETSNDGSTGGKKGGKIPATGDTAVDLGAAAAGLLAVAGAALARCE